jgi:uncharacterized oxidoreductase
MPLEDFIADVMRLLSSKPDASEVVVERCVPLRFAAENGKLDAMFEAVNSMNN